MMNNNGLYIKEFEARGENVSTSKLTFQKGCNVDAEIEMLGSGIRSDVSSSLHAESMAVKVNPTRKNFMEAKFIIEHFFG